MTAAADHVPEIERHIRVTKERVKSKWIPLSFNKVLGRIFIEMILFVVLQMNTFPPVGMKSQTYSPRTIMTYFTLDYSKHCIVESGKYVETH